MIFAIKYFISFLGKSGIVVKPENLIPNRIKSFLKLILHSMQVKRLCIPPIKAKSF
jgi:hypothetical protein